MDALDFLSSPEERPENGRLFYASAADGTRLRVALWPVENAKGTILIFSGRAEYIEVYARHAKDLTDAGYAVATLDWRGQGLSDRDPAAGIFGHVDDFADYQIDAKALLNEVGAANLPKPHFLLAHSMGGNIGLRFLIEGAEIRAAAFSSPMWALGNTKPAEVYGLAVSRLHMALGMGRRPLPGTGPDFYAVMAPFEDNSLTTSEEEWNLLRDRLSAHPEIGLGRPTCTWAYRAIRQCQMLQRGPLPEVPSVVLTGGDETVIADRGFGLIADRWPSARVEHFPQGRHELLIETPEIRARAFDIIVEHFNAHL